MVSDEERSPLHGLNTKNTPPLGLRWRSSTLFIISTVAMGMLTDLSLYCLVIPVLPFLLQDRLKIPHSQLQSYSSGLLALFAGASLLFSPVAGVIADQMSTRQAPFLLGLSALLASTILFAVGQNIPVLAIARILQGMSGAVVWTIGLAICLETVGPSNLGTTIGSIFSVISLGTELSPTIGGILYHKAGYAGVFGLAIALIAVDFLLRLLVIEKKTALKYQNLPSIDTNGDSEDEQRDGDQTTPTSEETPLLSGQKAQQDSLGHYVFRNEPPPWLKKVSILACVRDPALLTAWLVGFIHAFIIAAFDSTIPIIAPDYYDFDSMNVGLLFLAFGSPFFFISPVAGWAVDRFGTKIPTVLGFVYLIPVLLCLRFVRPGSTPEVALYTILLLLSGIGICSISSQSVVEAGAVVEKYYKANRQFFGDTGPYAQLYGINSMIVSAGFTFGPLVAGGLKESIGYGNMNAVLAALCAVTAILSWLYVGGRRGFNCVKSRHEDSAMEE